MSLPLFTPEEFSYLSSLSSPKEMQEIVFAKGIDHAIRFFLTAVEDRTWIEKEGGVFIQLSTQQFNRLFLKRRLSFDQMHQLVKACQEQQEGVNPYLDRDVVFILEGHENAVSSLFFGVSSNRWCELLWKEFGNFKKRKLSLLGISQEEFLPLADFVYKGFYSELWKEEKDVVFRVLKRASQWQMKEAAEAAAEIFKRYLSDENILEYLEKGQKENFPALLEQCCMFLSKKMEGAHFQFNEQEGLHVSLQSLEPREIPRLEGAAPWIFSLKCQGGVLKQEPFLLFARQCSQVHRLDLSETKGGMEDLEELFPKLQSLNLGKCFWLEDRQLEKWMDGLPNLTFLNLEQNRQLTFKSWKSLKNLRGLSHLDLSGCMQVEEEDLDLIVLGGQRLTELSLAGCEKLTDQALSTLARYCGQLAKLNLSDCRGLSEQGFIQLAAQPLPLQELIVKNCENFTEEALAAFLKWHPSLQNLHLWGCPISASALASLHAAYPTVDLKQGP